METIIFETSLLLFISLLFYVFLSVLAIKKCGKKTLVRTLPIHGIFFIFAYLSFENLLGGEPKLISATPPFTQSNSMPKEPITFTFSTVLDFNKLKIYTFPESLGSWQTHSYVPFANIGRSVTFIPQTRETDNDKIMLYFANISKPLSRTFGSEQLIEISQPKKIFAMESFGTLRDPPPFPSPTPVSHPQNIHLDVPYFAQTEMFTCNIAALRMLLSYRNIFVSETDLKKNVGSSGSRGNGNPHLGYTSSYGTYWEPIGKIAGSYREFKIFDHPDLVVILNEVASANPVMIWGQNGWSDPHELSWTTPDGEKIYAINGMHSYVVTGFDGPVHNPEYIYVNDPWRGQYKLDTQEFLRRWSFFNMALVVY